MSARPVPPQEFEQALLDVLMMDYDLKVRLEADRLERRQNGYATLVFDYPTPETDPRTTKAIVRIRELPGFSCVFNADLSAYDAMIRSAEECESLALAIIEVTDALELEEVETPRMACGGRRAED